MLQYIQRYSKSIKNVGYYFAASFIPLLITLALNPLYSLYLTPKDYAIIGYYNSFNILFSPFILFYFNQYFMREYFYRDEAGKIKLKIMILKAFTIMPFVLGLIAIFVIFIYKTFFNKGSEILFFPYALLALLPSMLVGLYRLELLEHKVQRDGKGYLKICLINGGVVALSSVVFIVFAKFGAIGQYFGNISGPLFFYVFVLYKNRGVIHQRFDFGEFKKAVYFCWPLVIAGMFDFFSNGYDKVILEKLVSVEELGYYSIGISIGSYLSIFSGAINDTFSPDIYDSLAKKDFRRMLKYVSFQIGTMLGIVLVFVVLAKYVIYILTAGRYVAATPYAQIGAFGALTSTIYCVITNVVQSYKKTEIVMTTKFIGSIICLLSYSFLIKNYTLIGAAIGYALGNVYFSIIAVFLLFISLKLKKERL